MSSNMPRPSRSCTCKYPHSTLDATSVTVGQFWDEFTFKVPWEGDQTHYEANKGTRREKPVRYIGGHLNTVVDDTIQMRVG